MTTEEDGETPEPISPDEIEVDINYEPDPTDLVLSSVPGGELFNPRKHKFSEDELKPQPMIKKAKKVYVPEEQKVCWERDKGGLSSPAVCFTVFVHSLFHGKHHNRQANVNIKQGCNIQSGTFKFL